MILNIRIYIYIHISPSPFYFTNIFSVSGRSLASFTNKYTSIQSVLNNHVWRNAKSDWIRRRRRLRVWGTQRRAKSESKFNCNKWNQTRDVQINEYIHIYIYIYIYIYMNLNIRIYLSFYFTNIFSVSGHSLASFANKYTPVQSVLNNHV